jgi:hypothetical protein
MREVSKFWVRWIKELTLEDIDEFQLETGWDGLLDLVYIRLDSIMNLYICEGIQNIMTDNVNEIKVKYENPECVYYEFVLIVVDF